MPETQTQSTQTPDLGIDADRRAAAHLRAMQDITPAVAHDLRAPINAMVFNIEILKETIASGKGLEPGGRERQLRYVGVLHDELARLHRALEIFLAQTSPRENRTDTIDLREPVGELAELLVGPARKHQVQVDLQLPDEPLAVTVNRSQLRQALLQVGVAALAGIPRGERLTVRLEPHRGRTRLWIGGPADPAVPEVAAGRADLEMARQVLAELGGELREVRDDDRDERDSDREVGLEVRL